MVWPSWSWAEAAVWKPSKAPVAIIAARNVVRIGSLQIDFMASFRAEIVAPIAHRQLAQATTVPTMPQSIASWNRPKIEFCEIFNVVRFSTFSTISVKNRHRYGSASENGPGRL
jgi:hypothetical protein